MPPLSTQETSTGPALPAPMIIRRSSKKIILTGSETPEEAEKAALLPIAPQSIPVFNSFAEARLHIKQRLAAGFRIFAKYGYDEGVAGHLTVRDPEYPNLFWVNAFGEYFGHIRASDLILCDHEGNVVRGSRPVNKAAFVIHSKVHEARPDVVAACHSHTMYGRSFSALGRKLLPISQDSCAFYEDHGLYNDYKGVVLDDEEGIRVGKALGEYKSVILQNHGLLTVGKTVEEAVWWFISMDRCCQTQLIAEAAVKLEGLKLIGHEDAKITYSTVGTPGAGWFMAQPIFDMIIREQPDCLE